MGALNTKPMIFIEPYYIIDTKEISITYKIRDILTKVVSEDPDVLKVPQPIIRLEDFSDKGYVFLIRGFLSSGNTLRQWDITSNIRMAVVEELGAVGIQIAAPRVNVLIAKNSADILGELKQ